MNEKIHNLQVNDGDLTIWEFECVKKYFTMEQN